MFSPIKMNNFNNAFDKLFKWVSSYASSPDDEPWFQEELNKLINDYGSDVAIQFAQNEEWPEYTFELLTKSGLRDIPKEREDEVYEMLLLRVKSWKWKSKDKCEIVESNMELI